MKRIFLLLLIILLFEAAPAHCSHAIPTSGDYLLFCQETIKLYNGKPADKSAANSCLGFVEGALGMHEVFSSSDQGTPFYCIPDLGLSSFDVIQIWVKYLRNNPQKLHNAPVISFILSLRETYPCREDQNAM